VRFHNSLRRDPIALLPLIATALVGCAESTSPQQLDERAITVSVLTDFLRRTENVWPVVYISDQYLTFKYDSSFVTDLPPIAGRYVIASRVQAEERPDIVKDAGLLLEPLAARSHCYGSVRQPLNFSANADYGGGYVYSLRRTLLGWRVTRIVAVWTI
jgi:hypothetical protein